MEIVNGNNTEGKKFNFGTRNWVILLAFTAIGALLAYMGFSAGNLFWGIIGVVLLAICGFVIWLMFSPEAQPEKKVEKNPLMKDARDFLRKTILPLGFQEKHEILPRGGSMVIYSRDGIAVRILHDFHDQYYSFWATTDSSRDDTSNDFNYSWTQTESKNKDSREKAFQKFRIWLKENQII